MSWRAFLEPEFLAEHGIICKFETESSMNELPKVELPYIGLIAVPYQKVCTPSVPAFVSAVRNLEDSLQVPV